MAEQAYNEWHSRKELLTSLLNKFLAELDKMNVYDAVSFSSPMSECLIHAVGEAQQLNSQKDGGQIIDNILNSEP